MEKIKITNLSFVSVRPQESFAGTFLGFANLTLNDFIELNSIGCHKEKKGELIITFPSRKLVNNSLKFYYEIIDNEVKTKIKNEIEAYLEKIEIWSANTKVEKK
jgi:DNA-binding cell septation regulator SpoVG